MKKSIFASFTELKEKESSRNRIDYVYPQSAKRAKILATKIYPSGNGYVIGKFMQDELIHSKGYQVDSRGWINIKNFSREELQEVISFAIKSLNNGMNDFQARTPKPKTESLKEPITEIGKIPSKHLVESCLYNWLGYGQVNSPIWFMGMEEGGAEVWRNKTLTLDESLECRSNFNLQMDFQYVWENLYGVPLDSFKGPTVWRFIAAFLLELESEQVDATSINDFLFISKKLGRNESNHFLAELMPLPKPSRANIQPYQNIWNTVRAYEKDVKEKRFDLIKEVLIKNSEVQLIVSYDRSLTEMIFNHFQINIEKARSWKVNTEQYHLHKFNLIGKRTIYLLVTPFFGNGRVSYEGISKATKEVKNIIIE
ncbi:hypothetical protein MHH33_16855 [Paenisporosarcina sp. FSL H8-0542]|uniref:hypothetical protein n=1 Tax=Paenisporosarcina sp. FSL H8-0542 TaxID=2921401 RepID=UPI003159C6E6